jgi:hypothetical protein
MAVGLIRRYASSQSSSSSPRPAYFMVTTLSGISAVMASLSEAIGMEATSPPRWVWASRRRGAFHLPGKRSMW